MRTIVWGAAVALFLGLSGMAFSQPQTLAELPPHAVIIAPGERVALSAETGDPVVVSRGAAQDVSTDAPTSSAYEQVGQMRVKSQMPAAPPGQLVLQLTSDPKNGARLIGQDGADYPVIYSAVLVLKEGERQRYVSTSICPVQPGRPGLESWGNDVAGIAITGVRRVGPQDTACNNGSLLAAATDPAGQRYACSSRDAAAGPIPAFQITLITDANGAVSEQTATWTLSSPDIIHSPMLGFDYAMEGDRLTPGARDARVLAAVSLNPRPKSKTADVVLLYNGAEVVRRPWRMFATNMAAPPPAAGPTPTGFFGLIPLAPASDPAADQPLRRFLATVGHEPGTLEVRVVGDAGEMFGDANYPVGASTPITDQSQVDAALAKVRAAAKTPSQCQAVKPG